MFRKPIGFLIFDATLYNILMSSVNEKLNKCLREKESNKRQILEAFQKSVREFINLSLTKDPKNRQLLQGWEIFSDLYFYYLCIHNNYSQKTPIDEIILAMQNWRDADWPSVNKGKLVFSSMTGISTPNSPTIFSKVIGLEQRETFYTFCKRMLDLVPNVPNVGKRDNAISQTVQENVQINSSPRVTLIIFSRN